MKRQASTTRRGVAAFAVAAAALASLGANVASADHLNPGEVAFVGSWAADGSISAADAALPEQQRVVDWQDPAPGVSDQAEGRFTDANGVTISGGNCGPFVLSVNGTAAPGYGYLNASCLGAAPQGQIDWRVRWFDSATSTWTSESTDSLIIDTILPTVAISSPANGSLVGVVVRSNGARVVPVAGTAEPGSTVRVFEGAILLGTGTANANGQWTVDTQMATGTHTIFARATDAAGNTAQTAPITIDVDASQPVLFVDTVNPVIFAGDEPALIEGTAADTNNQAFGGVIAVEVHVFAPLTPDLRPENLQIPPSDPTLSGVARVGKMVLTDNVDCTPTGTPIRGKKTCAASGTQQVSWRYDASMLPAGVYTIEIKVYDKAGNTANQPEEITLVKLG